MMTASSRTDSWGNFKRRQADVTVRPYSSLRFVWTVVVLSVVVHCDLTSYLAQGLCLKRDTHHCPHFHFSWQQSVCFATLCDW